MGHRASSGLNHSLESLAIVSHFSLLFISRLNKRPEPFYFLFFASPYSIQMNPYDSAAKMLDGLMFVNLLRELLDFDVDKRICASSALHHPFITMDHLQTPVDQP